MWNTELRRYSDPATDLEVLRLTNPDFASGLTAPDLRQFAHRGETLIYWSDRDGTRQAYRMDTKSGESRQLTNAAALHPASISLSTDERFLYYIDGNSVNSMPLATSKSRAMYTTTESVAALSVATDGSVFFCERRGAKSRVMHLGLKGPDTAFEQAGEINRIMTRPRRAQLAFRIDGAWWIANADGSGKRQMKLEPGATGEALWSLSGRTFLYLHAPDDPKRQITMREYAPDEDTDTLVANTSQFGGFDSNADSSVFVGASSSKASAYILLLLRVTRRELTLCEHRASDPAMVIPVFSPDSQRVYFVSDRHGNRAIYRIAVDKFVEETG